MNPLMNTREVAEYLRIKERKVYDLVAQKRIPCTRVAGKWLFPKDLIDVWLRRHAEGLPERLVLPEPPNIIAGSHDPLLDWAVRESGSGLALLFAGSLDGLDRFVERQASACGLHIPDRDSDEYNIPLLQQRVGSEAVVAIEWAWRQQGLIVAAGNPLDIKTIDDVVGKPFAMRQKEAGSHLLLDHLLNQTKLNLSDISPAGKPLRSETEVAQAVAEGHAAAGLGVAAAALPLGLEFIPLIRERYDLLIWRRDYFEPPLQTLLAFVRTEAFIRRAGELAGYDISGLGTVRFNGLG